MLDVVVIKESQIQVVEKKEEITVIESEVVKEITIDVPEHTHPALDPIPIRELETLLADIPMGTPHTLPNGSAYTPDTGHNGKFMHLALNGQRLRPHSSDSIQDGDYAETSSTQITFVFDVKSNEVLEYVIYR